MVHQSNTEKKKPQTRTLRKNNVVEPEEERRRQVEKKTVELEFKMKIEMGNTKDRTATRRREGNQTKPKKDQTTKRKKKQLENGREPQNTQIEHWTSFLTKTTF